MRSETDNDAFLERFRNLSHPDGSPIRALVVDDEPNLLDLINIGLRMAGWTVRTAVDGPSAVAAAREFRPDIMVLDIMMPIFDGLEVLKRVRAFQPGYSPSSSPPRTRLPTGWRGWPRGAMTMSPSRSAWKNWCCGSTD